MESWAGQLEAGNPEAAWDLFIERYRRLIFGVIHRYTADRDDVMDVFATVCAALRADDFARLRRCAEQLQPDRPISTWLVVVIRNLAIDWLRHRDGRRGTRTVADSLTPLQARIFEHVFVAGCSHVEAYELIRSQHAPDLTFSEYLGDLTATYRATASWRGHLAPELAAFPPEPEPRTETSELDPAVLAERRELLVTALEGLSDRDRLAVQLFVVEEMPATQVARALGYPNAKAIYNRVYRALESVRQGLERIGIRSGDL